MSKTRNLARVFLIIGGITHFLSGVGHYFLPRVLDWGNVLKETPTVVWGIDIPDIAILYLFNAEFIGIGIGTALLSFIYAPKIQKGNRTAAMFCIYWGAFLFYRAIIGLYYFGTTTLSIVLFLNIVLSGFFYIFPLFILKEFAKGDLDNGTL